MLGLLNANYSAFGVESFLRIRRRSVAANGGAGYSRIVPSLMYRRPASKGLDIQIVRWRASNL